MCYSGQPQSSVSATTSSKTSSLIMASRHSKSPIRASFTPELHWFILHCQPSAAPSQPAMLLVEELIDGHRDNFRKFIANRSAKPLASVLAEAELVHVAEFLSFTQHVQYWKTKGMVYLSDLQGVLCLLRGNS